MLYWKYGANACYDDVAIILNKMGKRCTECKRVALNKFLKNGQCPECRDGGSKTPVRVNAGIQ